MTDAANPVVDRALAQKTGFTLLQRRVVFKESTKPDLKMKALKRKYRPINEDSHWSTQSTRGIQEIREAITDYTTGSSAGEFIDSLGFRRPTQILFRKERLSTSWENILPVGPGFNNLGNTCYINVILQALIYTPPLTNYMLTKEHSSLCKMMEFCSLCELEQLANRCFSSNKMTDENQAISPKKLLGHLRAIAKNFRIGRQEDAHEFGRYFVDVLQRNCLHGFDSKMDERIKETTLIHQVFGGYLRNEIKCSTCDFESNTFDPILDLSLDVKNCKSVEKALEMFTKSEKLVEDNQYFCERCDKLSDAAKRMSIYEAPVVLTVQLKRYLSNSETATKLAKPMSYPETLDINPYMSNDKDTVPLYKLYAVLVHTGNSCNSGHYYVMIKAPSGAWYSIDDDKVKQVSQENVLKEKAYMLFYAQSAIKPSKPLDKPASIEKDSVQNKKQIVSTTSTSPSAINDEIGEVINRKVFKKKLKEKKKALPKPKPQEIPSQPVTKVKAQEPVAVQLPTLEVFEPTVDEATSQGPSTIIKPLPAVKSSEVVSLKTQVENEKESLVSEEDKAFIRELKKSTVVNDGPTISWDENVESKRSKLDIVIEKEAAREPKVFTELKTNSQFDRQVLSWDDTDNAQSAREDILSEFKSKHKRPSSYDAEYDRGKVKKVKAKKEHFFAEKNSFQSEQNFRNLIKKTPFKKGSKK
ncbi:hypothetical protein K7432_006450 [Basidiobolus ranarum]|uniref:Ubiquitin carboxyl-terminal hydrolase n=1 Tax=Basidiobolus ranarum TaxID=34480 RepID=A0ABR2WV10_9FUNG